MRLILPMELENKITVLRPKLEKPIVLVGTGGAGKSSIGKLLAEMLGLVFVDADDVIAEQEKKSIPDIFKEFGEEYFRGVERGVMMGLAERKETHVIGTGGGAFMDSQTRNVILANMLSVFLEADLQTLQRRVGTGEGRPLFDGKSVEDVLQNMINQRYPIYKQADLTVSTRDEPEKETLGRVINALYMHINA